MQGSRIPAAWRETHLDSSTQIFETIAVEIGAQPRQVAAAVGLLDEGATVPFVARYRKEATGGLDDTQLRKLSERLVYLREMEDRRKAIVESIRTQGKLTDDLARALSLAQTKSELEDIYLPFRPKKRTRATIAREKGLEPLADLLFAQDAATDEPATAETTTDQPEGSVIVTGSRIKSVTPFNSAEPSEPPMTTTTNWLSGIPSTERAAFLVVASIWVRPAWRR